MKKSIGATLTLKAVAEHFKQWRSVKKKGERIPDHLWSKAVGLVGAYGISQVTRTLRLSGTDLNKRRGIIGTGQRRRDPGGGKTFVEIDRTLVDQAMGPEATAVWMELERPDGQRLRIQSTQGVDMLALAVVGYLLLEAHGDVGRFYTDAALGLALFAFVGTVVMAYFVGRGKFPDE